VEKMVKLAMADVAMLTPREEAEGDITAAQGEPENLGLFLTCSFLFRSALDIGVLNVGKSIVGPDLIRGSADEALRQWVQHNYGWLEK
jgi:hypothetical protein